MERTPIDTPLAAVVAPDFRHTSSALDSLIAALWRERELLEQLLFSLTSQRYILEAGALRWLASSSAQVGLVVETLREHEVVRAMMAQEVALDLDLPTTSTMTDLAPRVGPPADVILGDLASALRELTAEIDGLVRRNEALLLNLVGPGRGQSATEVAP